MPCEDEKRVEKEEKEKEASPFGNTDGEEKPAVSVDVVSLPFCMIPYVCTCTTFNFMFLSVVFCCTMRVCCVCVVVCLYVVCGVCMLCVYVCVCCVCVCVCVV